MLALGVAILLSRTLDWMPLREGLAHLASTFLGAVGYVVRVQSSPDEVILSNGFQRYQVTEKCSYVDLILMLGILAWRDRSPFLSNLRVVGALSALVTLLNAIRIALLAHWVAAGATWYWAHDLPDSVLYWSAFGIGALGWLHLEFRSPANKP